MKHNLNIITKSTGKTKPTVITLLHEKEFPAWLKKQESCIKNWLGSCEFSAKAGSVCIIPDTDGKITQVLAGVDVELDIWSIAHLPAKLPEGVYALEKKLPAQVANNLALGWALATYQFSRYRSKGNYKKFPQLVAPENADFKFVKSFAEAIFWARDLINTPANDLTPEELAKEAAIWAKAAKGKVKIIKGVELQKENFPMIYTVGKAAAAAPHLVDMRFPRKGAPKVTLVGKGVTFDSGGLDIKPTSGMKLMKKDMGGAANVLALAKVIVESGIPVQLRVLLPLVENAVAGNAMRPLDIVPTRKGINVEIGNTDAEGRLILCDALFEGDSEAPDLLIDCATLTGAARVALGTEIPAFFTNSKALANELREASERECDPLWQLPLWKNYRTQLDTPNADLSNDPDSSYAGAITAALFLQEFVSNAKVWLHVDMMAWNLQNKAGRPAGGEVMGIRALYSLIKEKYGN